MPHRIVVHGTEVKFDNKKKKNWRIELDVRGITEKKFNNLLDLISDDLHDIDDMTFYHNEVK